MSDAANTGVIAGSGSSARQSSQCSAISAFSSWGHRPPSISGEAVCRTRLLAVSPERQRVRSATTRPLTLPRPSPTACRSPRPCPAASSPPAARCFAVFLPVSLPARPEPLVEVRLDADSTASRHHDPTRDPAKGIGEALAGAQPQDRNGGISSREARPSLQAGQGAARARRSIAARNTRGLERRVRSAPPALRQDALQYERSSPTRPPDGWASAAGTLDVAHVQCLPLAA